MKKKKRIFKKRTRNGWITRHAKILQITGVLWLANVFMSHLSFEEQKAVLSLFERFGIILAQSTVTMIEEIINITGLIIYVLLIIFEGITTFI